jgi:ABC-2 type transport system ATP-binding protein
MTSESVVQFEDVHMVFHARFGRPVHALRGFSLDVERGSVLGLLGPNGAGKTTFISCLLGLLSPQVGTIRALGKPMLRGASLASCGVLLEDTRLPPFVPVRDALDTACALRGIAKKERARVLASVVEQTGTGDLLARSVRALSKGQARRVGLAAALLGDPPLLILDEPSAGLDVEARIEFERLVRGLSDGRRTLIIASHLLGDVEATCTHLAIVTQGRVILRGRADELLGEARRGQKAEVHVDAGAAAALDALGVRHQPSPYPGLLLLESDLPEEELFAALARERIVPRRVEPKVSVLSLYLQATKDAS